MLRFNIFNMLHKALRAMLYDTALTLQQTSFTNKDEAIAAFKKLNEVIEAFEQHGHHEDSMVIPVIEKFQPAITASFEKDHIDDRKMGDDLKHLQNIYLSLQSQQERIIAGSAITKTFVDYMIFNLNHMQREEIELNKLLWDHYSDDEIQKINDQIVADIAPEEMMKVSQWMMRGINADEAKKWLTSVKENAPPVIFEALFQLTETSLPERFRTSVQDTVMAHKVAEPVF